MIPLVLFILPCLFLVDPGPAGIQIADTFSELSDAMRRQPRRPDGLAGEPAAPAVADDDRGAGLRPRSGHRHGHHATTWSRVRRPAGGRSRSSRRSRRCWSGCRASRPHALVRRRRGHRRSPLCVASADSTPGLSAYLAVPPWSPACGTASSPRSTSRWSSGPGGRGHLAADPAGDAVERRGCRAALARSSAWASGCSRAGSRARLATCGAPGSLRRRAPADGALHQLASAGDLGLDSASLATDLDAAMRAATGGARVDGLRRRAGRVAAAAQRRRRRRPAGGEIDAARTRADAGSSRRSAARRPAGARLLRPGRRPPMDRRARRSRAARWPTTSPSGWTRPCCSTTSARLPPPRSATGSRATCTTASRRRSSPSATSSTRSSRSATTTQTTRARASPCATRSPASSRRSASRSSTCATTSPTAGCPASLADYAREVSHATGLRVHLSLDESGPPLPPRTATEVLRVAQEAIGNVRKHAQADNLWVTFDSDGIASCSLEVEDDGVGNAEPRERHWGLQTMRERAAGVGADLDVITSTRRRNRRHACGRPRPPPHEGRRSHEHHRATG